MLVFDTLLVMRLPFRLADELCAVRLDVLIGRAGNFGLPEVLDKLGRGARDPVFVPLADDAAVRVGDCVTSEDRHIWAEICPHQQQGSPPWFDGWPVRTPCR